jgi:hypothetical protein
VSAAAFPLDRHLGDDRRRDGNGDEDVDQELDLAAFFAAVEDGQWAVDEIKLGKTFRHKGKKVGYFEAKCPDGGFEVTTPKVLFENEADVPNVPPSTTLKGTALIPCTPKV